MDKAKISANIKKTKEKGALYLGIAKEFLPPQSPREKKLILSYATMTVLVTAILNGFVTGNLGLSLGGGGSRTVYKVDTIYTPSNWAGFESNNQTECAKLDQSSEYDSLMRDGWKITSTQSETKTISGFTSGNTGTGECRGTLYVMSK